MTAPVLMVVGTASSVGKSVLVTALCRIFADAGVRVAPFKAQNMSNNADVTPDGLEIGRAQSEQAAAARVEPSVDMNPVLLKPQGDRTSHVVLNGRPAGTLQSSAFRERKPALWPHVTAALDRLRSEYDLVIAEGAGSPAEPNLQASDIVNMAVARYTGAVTLLAGDIDRGGVFAHLLGTLEYLPPDDRALVCGFLVNRFRGDPVLLGPAIEDLERRTGIPVLGVVPRIDNLALAEEDAVTLERPTIAPAHDAAAVTVAVVRFPRIANFDDVDPLLHEPGVRVRFTDEPGGLRDADLVVLPGTRATIADLAWMRSRGLDVAVVEHAARGGAVLGLCGGYQVLGRRIVDREGVEAPRGSIVPGLGLLPVDTTFTPEKQTRRVSGRVLGAAGPWSRATDLPVSGYEIHMGQSTGVEHPFLAVEDRKARPEGAISPDGRIAGTYLHGLLHGDALRHALLAGLGRPGDYAGAAGTMERRDAEFDRLAATVRNHVDLSRITSMLGLEPVPGVPGGDAS